MIQKKIGKCADCGQTTRLVSGRCNRCYWDYRKMVNNSKKPELLKQKRERAARLSSFFKDEISKSTHVCENCGASLRQTMAINPRATIAHIIEKRHFHSVETHPANKWYGCGACHTDYDNKGWEHAQGMKVWPVIVARFKTFAGKIWESEARYLPAPLRAIYDQLKHQQ